MEEENIIQSMNLTKETTMIDFVKTNIKYLVVFPDRKTKTYKTLVDIQRDICINTSTNAVGSLEYPKSKPNQLSIIGCPSILNAPSSQFSKQAPSTFALFPSP